MSENSFHSFIGGVDATHSDRIHSLIDPSTGQVWGQSNTSVAAVGEAIHVAAEAFAKSGWSQMEGWQRGAVLNKLGDLLIENADQLARYETLANGKPATSTLAEVKSAAHWYRFFAAECEVREDRYRELSTTRDARIVEEPLGVVAAITPFNGAISLGSWKIAPALAAGNAVIVKPPIQACASTLLLAKLAIRAGLPAGLLNVVVGDAVEGQLLATDPRVDCISFTGSTQVARILGASVTGRLARFVCEAGGKSAHIVMDDADMTSAVIAVTQGLFSGSGQTCVAGSRILVHEAIFDEFVERLVAHAGQLVVGDPSSPGTHLGPIGSERQLNRIDEFVNDALDKGATAVLGGATLPMSEHLVGGYWYSPTILVDTTPEMSVCREEVFGPVGIVQSVSSLDDAIEQANDSEYGLAAGIWTTSASVAHEAGQRLRAGTVWVNTYRAIDWRVPFGGYKQSGLGRENGVSAVSEFTQTKSVVTDYKPPIDPFGIA